MFRSPVRVVVADDFPLVRYALVGALEGDPAIAVVGEAATGAEALQAVGELTADVLVLDVRLPQPSGLTVIDRLACEHPHARAVVVTASENPVTLFQAIDAGAAGYLGKRATAEDLRRAVLAAHAGGAVVDPQLASHLVRRFAARPSNGNGGPADLGTRELEAVRLVAAGHTDEEIALHLGLSIRGVQHLLARARRKTGVARRSGLARWAVERALV